MEGGRDVGREVGALYTEILRQPELEGCQGLAGDGPEGQAVPVDDCAGKE